MRPAINDSFTSGQPLYLLYSNSPAPEVASAARAVHATGSVRLQVTGRPPTTSGPRAAVAEVERPKGSAAAAAPIRSDRRRLKRSLCVSESKDGGTGCSGKAESYHQPAAIGITTESAAVGP